MAKLPCDVEPREKVTTPPAVMWNNALYDREGSGRGRTAATGEEVGAREGETAPKLYQTHHMSNCNERWASHGSPRRWGQVTLQGPEALESARASLPGRADPFFQG